MSYLGDHTRESVVTFAFTTNTAAGGAVAPSTAFEAADLRIYKNDSATERSSSAGVTMTSPFDSVTGLHHVAIDTSDDTDGGFFAPGNDYHAILVPDETVDGQTVVAVLATWSIENRFINANVVSVASGAIAAGAFGAGAITAGAFAAGAINAAAIAADAIGASELAADAVTEIADGILKRDMSAVTGESSRSLLNALRFLRNKWSISGATLTVTKEDDSTTAWTAALTTNASADPVTASDPS